jgi:protein NrfC
MNSRLTRRNFLKCTGLVVFSLGGGCYVMACTPAETQIPPAEGYLVVDAQKCQGCLSCMLACSLAHEGRENLSLSRIQIIQNPFEKFPHDLGIFQCRQCSAPACVDACPEGALIADPLSGLGTPCRQDNVYGLRRLCRCLSLPAQTGNRPTG